MEDDVVDVLLRLHQLQRVVQLAKQARKITALQSLASLLLQQQISTDLPFLLKQVSL